MRSDHAGPGGALTAPPLHLLLAHAGTGAPALPRGVTGDAAERAAAPAWLPPTQFLRNRGRDPNDLGEQRWGVIAPEGEAGDRLLAIARPLIDQRRADQGGHDVRIYRAPPRMDDAEAARWHRQVYLDDTVPEAELPFYQLILGDLDQVPLALQQVQMIDGVVGRLAFGDERGYAAYIAKLLQWERTPSPRTGARSVFYTVHDGSDATSFGYDTLITPALAIARAERGPGFSADDIVELGAPRRPPSPGELCAAVAADPAVLLSMSHGEGAPPAGWPSVDHQRRHQGAMSFGGGAALTGEDIAARRFLPGGVWFMFGCYSAGTPDASVYRPWLDELHRLGAFGAGADAVLHGLPRPGERPFVSALAGAALANPDGPIGFIGHVDLAWSYSFQELDAGASPKNRIRRFTSLLGYALRRDRLGVAFRELASCALAADTELLGLYAQPGAELPPAQRVRRGHLWMLRHDLLGYILLGDPAARLPITPAAAAEPRGPRASDLFPFAVAPGRPSASSVPTAHAAPPSDPLEQAILQLLLGARDAEAIARDHGLDRAELERLAAQYRAAGRAAIDRVRGRPA